MKFKLFLVISFCFCFKLSNSQQSLIKYDIVNGNLKYYKVKLNGDTTQVPVINLTKSNKINLYIQNLSGGFSDSIFYENKQEINESVQLPWDGIIKNITNYASTKNNPELISNNEKTNLLEVNKMGNAKSIYEEQSAKVEYINSYQKFTAFYNNWAKAAMFANNCKTLSNELTKLRYSLQTPSDEVKHIAKTKASLLFPQINENTSILQLVETASSFDTESTLKQLENAYNNMNSIAMDVSLQSDKKVDSSQKIAKKLMSVANSFKDVGTKSDAVLVKIADLYQQIMQDNYTRNRPLLISRNTNAIVLHLRPIIDKKDSSTLELLNIKEGSSFSITIPVLKKSSLRFRNTYGLSFVAFSENKWRYFVKTNNNVNKIERETSDYFQPVMSTFLHFYAPRDKGFRWGGSFGAGLPVGSNLETKVNILLGLSTFLGKNDPIAITIGCSGSKINKLSGYQLGDTVSFTELDENKHYNSVYRVGYYLSISFNPASLNAKN